MFRASAGTWGITFRRGHHRFTLGGDNQMCGIAGLAGADAVRHHTTVAAMGLAQRHRGPDGTRHLTSADGRAVLSMNTLLIVDTTAQPGSYQDPASGVLTFNGEIYNYRQAAAGWGIQLEVGETDAHLVLRAWVKLGPGCLAGLDGMFALAAYDPREGRLFLARDRLGEKLLYWRLDGGRLAFASEVTTLIGYGTAPLVVRPEMLSIETPTGVDTPVQGIQLLPPAGLLAFEIATGSLVQRTWWQLEGLEPWQGDYHTALARFSTLLADRVPMRAPGSDFALLLSGGLDSSVLAYLMRPQLCVTVRYPGQDRLDESAIAAAVARDVGAELVIIEPTIQDFTCSLPQIMHALDYPMATRPRSPSTWPTGRSPNAASGWWSAGSGRTSS